MQTHCDASSIKVHNYSQPANTDLNVSVDMPTFLFQVQLMHVSPDAQEFSTAAKYRQHETTSAEDTDRV